MLAGAYSRVATALLVTVFLGGPAYSAGYFIDQQSIPGLGRADAGDVAAASDPSTVFFNPAGMTELWWGADPADIRRASSGVALIIPSSKLKNAGSTVTVPVFNPLPAGLGVPIAGPNQ